jgi:DNA-binding LytR/AlgR family response regulator
MQHILLYLTIHFKAEKILKFLFNTLQLIFYTVRINTFFTGTYSLHFCVIKLNMMQPNNNNIAISSKVGHFLFNTEEIVRLEACSNYTNIYFTNKKKILISKVLKEFAEVLEPMGFVRTHRTHLVNKQYIAFVSHDGNIVMKDESVAEISRRMKSGVMKVLKNAA